MIDITSILLQISHDSLFDIGQAELLSNLIQCIGYFYEIDIK